MNIGYEPRTIKKALDKANNGHSYNHAKPKDLDDNHNDHTYGTRAYLPYIQGVTDKISKIVKKSNITTSFKPLETIKQKMKSVKDPIDPKQIRGVYNIPCSCNTSYIGETG